MFDRLRRLLRAKPPERLDKRYPYIGQFFGCYLHQDWPEDAGSWEAAADQFLAGESADHVRRAVADLDRLLADARGETDLRRALDAFGNAYDPTAEGLSLRAWLAQVGGRLAAGQHRDPAV